MTKDKLIRAKELDQQIETTKEEIQKWNRATGLQDVKIQVKQGKMDATYVSLDSIGFDTMRGLALDKLKTHLSGLENQFRKL